MAAQFIRHFIRPPAQRFMRDMGEDFASTVLQDQYEQATGFTVRTPPPSTPGGFVGTVLGTAFNGSMRSTGMAVPMWQCRRMIDHYRAKVQQLHMPVQRQAYLRQRGGDPDDAARADRELSNGSSAGLGDVEFRMLASSMNTDLGMGGSAV